MTQPKNNIAKYWEGLDEAWRVAITVFVITRLFYAVWSWVILTLQPLAIQNLELSGEQLISIFSLQNNRGYIYLRELDGETLTFQAADTDHIADQQTGSIWDISSGQAVQGHYQGMRLEIPRKISPDDIFPYLETTPFPGKWIALWQRFDVNWYVSIAEDGYQASVGATHFPPLFPALIKLLMPFTGNAFLAGLLISHLATLYTLKLLFDLFTEGDQSDVGKRALLLFAIYPTFFFMFSVYSEPVFFVMVLLSFRYMRKSSWLWSGFWALCAIMTRLTGVALLIPMLYLMYLDPPFLRKTAHWAGLFLSGAGGLLYLFLRYQQLANNVVPMVESEWRTSVVAPWTGYLYAINTILSGTATFIDVLNWAIVTIFTVLLIVGWKKIPLEYNLYTTTSILIMLVRITAAQPLGGASRFSLALFPVFLMLSVYAQNPWIRRLIIYTSILLNLYLSAQFFLWGWVA